MDSEIREKERAATAEGHIAFVLRAPSTGREALERSWLRAGRGYHGEKLPDRLAADPTRRNVYVYDTGKGAAHNDGKTLVIDMVGIPAGEFTMGSDDAEAYPDEKPAHIVHLDHYWIALTPVTWAQYEVYCKDAKKELPPAPSWGRIPNHPVVNVSWHDCQEWCKWAGMRLPSEAEWEKAARGTDARKYPWGNEPPTPDKCVWADHPEYGGKSTAPVTKEVETDEVAVNPTSGKNEPTGKKVKKIAYERVAGESPYGAIDMAGNVWEWCEDAYDPDAYKRRHEENQKKAAASGTTPTAPAGNGGATAVTDPPAAPSESEASAPTSEGEGSSGAQGGSRGRSRRRR